MRTHWLLGSVLGLGLLAALGCASGDDDDDDDDDDDESDADTDADTDSDTDADSDTDTDTDADTGVYQFYFIGDFATRSGNFVEASMGYGFYGLRDDDWICRITGDLEYEGDASGCPDCDWAFDLSGVNDSQGTGEYCEQLGLTDGSIDGYIDYTWGFAPIYYYDYNGDDIPFELALMLYYEGDWFAFAFNYAGRDWVSGDEESFEIERPGFSGGGYSYGYYYPY